MNKLRVLFPFLFIFFYQLLFGQSVATTKGANLWSASGSFSSQSANIYARFGEERVKSVNIGMSYLRFVSNRLGVGPSFSLNRRGQNANNSTGSWGVGPRLFYFADFGKPILNYIGGGVDFVGVREGFNSTSTGFGINLSLGTMIRKGHLGVFFELGLQSQSVKRNRSRTRKGSTIYFSAGLAGFLY